MEQLKKVINSSWIKSAAVAGIGIVMISEAMYFTLALRLVLQLENFYLY